MEAGRSIKDAMERKDKNMSEKNNQNCVWIGISVDIEKLELRRDIVEMNNLLVGEYGANKSFAGGECPHLNLYDLSVPRENLELIVKKVKEMTESQKIFEIEMGKVNYFPFGLFFLEIKMNVILNGMHKKIVEEIVKLKGSCIDEDYLAPHRQYSKRQKELLMQYGNPYVLDQFQPHITVGHTRNQQDKLDAICKELSKIAPMTNFRVESVHIVTDGEKDNKKKNASRILLAGESVS